MSKIGDYNMELEEKYHDQLNELGFESLQDAITAGYVLTEDRLVKLEDLAYEQAQKDWELEKKATLEDLKRAEKILLKIHNECSLDNDYREIGTAGLAVQRAIDFIEKARF